MEDYNGIYPPLPDVETFRLQQSSASLSTLEKELDAREKILKKYKRASSILSKTCSGSGAIAVALTGSGLGVSLTGVGVPLGASLAAVGGLCGITSVVTGLIAKKIAPRLSKHEQTASICVAKVNTLKDIVSKALEDGKISPEEFRLIQGEVSKYNDMKRGIRSRSQEKNMVEELNLEEMRKEIRSEIMQKLASSQ